VAVHMGIASWSAVACRVFFNGLTACLRSTIACLGYPFDVVGLVMPGEALREGYGPHTHEALPAARPLTTEPRRHRMAREVFTARREWDHHQ
jgi:hypothetical protein